jgi:hypothetical protein
VDGQSSKIKKRSESGRFVNLYAKGVHTYLSSQKRGEPLPPAMVLPVSFLRNKIILRTKTIAHGSLRTPIKVVIHEIQE